MGNAEKFELSPLNGRKSFGGKCHAWRFPGGEFSLVSFGTLVATWHGGKLHRHWSGETGVPVQHVRSFAAFCGGADDVDLKAWRKMEVEAVPARLLMCHAGKVC